MKAKCILENKPFLLGEIVTWKHGYKAPDFFILVKSKDKKIKGSYQWFDHFFEPIEGKA